MSDWIPIKSTQKCPVCNHKGWCTRSRDGSVAKCMRVASERPIESGGWLHALNGVRRIEKTVEIPKLAKAELQLVYENALTAIPPVKFSNLIKSLWISEAALHFMGIGWLDNVPMRRRSGGVSKVNAWCFPMARPMAREHSTLCGLRLRALDGEKFSFTGGSEGLFIPSSQDSGPLFVVEGPTSCAAMVDLGLAAIGRPSCSNGASDVIRYARVNRCDDLVVVGDNDEEKKRPDGSSFYPGQDGAARLADVLVREGFSVRVLIPPVRKDVRDWKRAGGTREIVIRAIERLSRWRRKVA